MVNNRYKIRILILLHTFHIKPCYWNTGCFLQHAAEVMILFQAAEQAH